MNGGTADAAELSAFEFGSAAGTWLELDAFSGGVLVASDRENLVGGFLITGHTLSVSGATFDRLTLRVGPTMTDVAFLLVDHVVLTTGGDTGDTGASPDDTAVEDTAVADDTALEDTAVAPDDTASIDTAGPFDTGAPRDSGLDSGGDPVDGPPDDTDTADSGASKDSGCGCATGEVGVGWLGWLGWLALPWLRRR